MNALAEADYRKHASLTGGKRAAREETNLTTREETSRAEREETNRAREKTESGTEPELRPLSPYTIQNLDAAIAHLEFAMNADKEMAIFGQSYWYGRVLELRATPGIMQAQERRLRRLMDRFAATG
ncbi:MAG: hypothetical protein LBV73_23710 [Paraburkholderia sp.]|jgi:hypothetical protein|nr:hypothetical protein [Paraburkholderia sp.]